MDIDDFVCNSAGMDTETESFTRDELLSEASDEAFLETTDDDGREELTQNVDTAEEIFQEITTKNRVDAVRNVLLTLMDHPDLEYTLMKVLRTLQSRVREHLRVETEEPLTQTSITSCFTSTSRS
ncbi:hypothetical protein PPTG_06507 [Phytophthora nicotianae INRA-310]|uniref:Uncharacterized protein n=1 Tax=Phytophthora nicotianae (strain INRA-310) TaxID=761204 RepID=W2QTS6_PHYN3|nr:hypothetical protein PPTG_06507 [Phytophthora nicotianae INRA-310]ETN16346.1 hypothetical protein PPTG_06507 [Phytophthora nicotianae INRA-310]